MVKTRSQTNLAVIIDFDEASAAWNANKKKVANGCYKYICGHKLKNGNRCNRAPDCRLHPSSSTCYP